MSDPRNKAKEIFWAALDQSGDPEAFISEACGDDAQLRARVQALLDAHDQAGDFLAPSHVEATVVPDDGAAAEESPSASTAELELGRRIGPYKLLERIGEGGMGSVWVAQQSEPIKRRVAIKLIKAGMDSQQVLTRFEAERHALALMDHPNIARVLDGGVTEQGRPYFAMEYVKGVPLTEYCDQAKLSVKERLELFLPICHAVQHAHQKGIIHRDLKPANILVCLYDGKPVPKVIDFGLAKAMHQSLTEQSLYTAHGMMVGTPLYMSPEQAVHNNLDIDTRTDVYALGVILYELLTGSTPLERAQLEQAAFNEVLRLIKDVDPPKPSTRLSGSDSLPSVAAQRRIEPAHLTRSVTGDLDWVVMKALEKERSRRYETANGLAEDIRRHLSDEPVSAGPPSARYRMRKFIKRNRGGVIAACAVAITLLLGVAGTGGGMLWALSEKRAADAETLRATKAEAETAATLKLVEAERDKKEVALKDAESIAQFLSHAFQSPDPSRDGREIKVVELLDNAAKKLETDIADQPTRRAKLQHTLAKTYHNLGLYSKAIAVQEEVRDYYSEAFGETHPDTALANQRLCRFYAGGGRFDEALQLAEKTLALNVLGPEDRVKLLRTMSSCYSRFDRFDEAVQFAETALTLARELNGDEHPVTLEQMSHLAAVYQQVARYDEALQLQEKALTLLRKVQGAEHVQTLQMMSDLARSWYIAGRYKDALQLREKALPLYRTKLGAEHLMTTYAMRDLAESYHEVNRHDEAVQLREEVLKIRRREFGLEHHATLKAMIELAWSHLKFTRRNDVALQLLEEALPLCRKVYGAKHSKTIELLENLAIAYFFTNRREEALQLQEEVLRLRRELLPPEHPNILTAMGNLAYSYHGFGRYDDAIKLQEELLAVSRKVHHPAHEGVRVGLSNLATFYQSVGRLDDAIRLTEELVAICREALSPEHDHTRGSKLNLADLLFIVGRREECVALWKEVLNPPSAEDLNKTVMLSRVTDLNDAAWSLVVTPDKDGVFTHAEQAVQWARQANDLKPKDAPLLNTLGVAHYRAEAWAETIEALNSSIQHGADIPHNWLFIAMAHHQLQQTDQAAKWYDMALEWKRDNEAALQQDAELQGFFAEAAKLMKAAQDTAKDSALESPPEDQNGR